MFTGIIQAVGGLDSVQPHGGDAEVRISAGNLPMGDVRPGDSIATNGVCLTVVDRGKDWFSADASVETLNLSTLGKLRTGARVNLEKALAVGDRLGGHLVSGHVDGVGTVLRRWSDARSERFRLRAPDNLARYIAAKGSICVDGISLTVNRVDGAEFELNIIPATLRETTMSDYGAGTCVNLEVDVIARYLERLCLGDRAALPGSMAEGLNLEFLRLHGFHE